MSQNEKLFEKWKKWLERVYDDQLFPLISSKHMFDQFAHCLKHYDKSKCTKQSDNLFWWIRESYAAFVCSALRRMVDVSKVRKDQQHPISLVRVLQDIKCHADILTFEEFFRGYQGRPVVSEDTKFARRDFARITRDKKATRLSVERIQKDIKQIKQATAEIKTLTNKTIAHTDIIWNDDSEVKFGDIGKAICELNEIFELYWFLVNRAPMCDPLGSEYNIKDLLHKIWPEKPNE